ncbi:hypothetical protein [Kaistella palustris]|uniref:hypothetical protein n=1 Tax=Kaistella palustris TaxID=493376 RepID=UPI0004243320|nr:hypothetical protein [Kaistella palustris]
MNAPSQNKQLKDSEIQKQNQDLPNIPASSEKIKTGNAADEQIQHTSQLQKDGKTENTEKNPKQHR